VDERELSTVLKEQETVIEMDEPAQAVTEPAAEAVTERVARAERRDRKLQAKRKRRTRTAVKRAPRGATATLDLSAKKSKAELAEMYQHWKRIHDISGAILASLDEYSRHVKN
jgi:hypothetical protein